MVVWGVLLKALMFNHISHLLPLCSQAPEVSTAGQDGLPSLQRCESPPTPAKLGVYGQPVMEQSDWRELLQKRTQRLFAADLALSALRLLDTVTTCHKGLLNKVTLSIHNSTSVRSFIPKGTHSQGCSIS